MNQKQGYNGLGLFQGTMTVSACRTYKIYSNQDSQSPSRDFTPWPPKYETRVLTIKTFGKPDSYIQKEDALHGKFVCKFIYATDLKLR